MWFFRHWNSRGTSWSSTRKRCKIIHRLQRKLILNLVTLWETCNCDNIITCPKVILTTLSLLSPPPSKKKRNKKTKKILLHYLVNVWISLNKNSLETSLTFLVSEGKPIIEKFTSAVLSDMSFLAHWKDVFIKIILFGWVLWIMT